MWEADFEAADGRQDGEVGQAAQGEENPAECIVSAGDLTEQPPAQGLVEGERQKDITAPSAAGDNADGSEATTHSPSIPIMLFGHRERCGSYSKPNFYPKLHSWFRGPRNLPTQFYMAIWRRFPVWGYFLSHIRPPDDQRLCWRWQSDRAGAHDH